MNCACLVHKICGYYNKGVQVQLIKLTTRPGVGNLRLAKQMWFFWWRHLARLIFF